MSELKVGIAGAGLIAGVHMRAYAATDGVRVVAIADPVPGKAERLAAELGARAFDGIDDLLGADLDILSVCTPTPTHASLAIKGLQAGLSVLCEKPIARSLDDAHTIVEAAESAQGILMIGHVSRFEPDHRKAKDLVEGGYLGEITMMSHSVTTSLPGWSQFGWLSDTELSGGPLVDLAVHSFDFLSWVSGSQVVRVHAVGADTAVGATTYALVHLRYASGAIARVETSWAHPASHGFKLTAELVGTDGRVSWDYDHLAGGFLHRAEGDTVRFEPLGELGYHAEIASFVQAVRSGGPSPISGRDGLAALHTSLAAFESVRTGKTIDLTTLGGLLTAPLGVALVGCAHTMHAWAYARTIAASPNARLVGVFDNDRALAAPIEHDFGGPFFGNAAALLASPDVEAAVVCGATVEHRDLVDLAASHGCHVLCEKPIATTITDARHMVAACTPAGVQLHLAFLTRFLPLIHEVRTSLETGELGDVFAMVAGNRGRPPLAPHYPAWITDPVMAGGGALKYHSVHLTDIMRHVSGREVVSVAAEVESLMWDCGVDDIALMSLVFDNGMIGSVDPSWSVTADNPWDYDFSPRILGTRGSLVVDDLGSSLQLVSSRYGAGLRLVPFGADADALMVEAFIASVRAGELQPPCADGQDGLRALEVALAGYAAAAAAQPVMLGPG